MTTGSQLNSVLERNIHALRERHSLALEQRDLTTRLTDRISAFIGSMPFVYINLAIIIAWIADDLGWFGQRLKFQNFDESLVLLATAVSIEALFLTMFILISQNRAAHVARRRAELDMHVSLLSEHEITRLIHITTAMASHLGIAIPQEDEVEELKADVAPGSVLDKLEADDHQN